MDFEYHWLCEDPKCDCNTIRKIEYSFSLNLRQVKKITYDSGDVEVYEQIGSIWRLISENK